ncbi:MAG: protease HtpX [Steroidobacteraceae bacterium]|jgi:heat shock protein HtpX|nr:protease HtpX [Steroidobacteraceae bacterium]
MLRVLLLIGTNIAILIVASITLRLLGFEPWLAQQGINFTSLLVFGAMIGFGGSFFSLAISKWVAKKTMGVQIIEQPRSEVERWLVETVQRQAAEARIKMPEVGIFQSPEPNAFATGPSKNNSLVAVSTGLLERMRKDEVEAVLGHEVAHVANGDMVTLSLIQGVVNTFVFVLARVIGNIVDKVVFKTENGHGPAFWITTIVAEIVLGILATMIVMWFSRKREFRADEGGAYLAGKESMIRALEALKRGQEQAHGLPDAMRAFGIRSGGQVGGLKRLFLSHPPLDERIAALRAAA